ncbi:protocadherin beta-18 [Ciona intestinalis]
MTSKATYSRICKICLMLSAVLQIAIASPPEKRTIRIQFLEEQPEATVVYNLKEDLLASQREGVYFKMLSQYMTSGVDITDDVTEWVQLDENSGIVTVNTPVDRETMCDADDTQPCVIHVKIARKPRLHFLMIDLELLVKDINDHAPIFPISPIITVNVSEAVPMGTKISLDKYLATDDDVGRNKDIVYVATSSDNFGIHQFKDETGAPHLELVVADELDHETAATEDLIITASDRGTPTLKNHVTLRIGILDANDNAPAFDRPLYTLNLRENLPRGEIITSVQAHDEDSGTFGQIRYFVPASGNSQTARKLIRVDPITGDVMLKQPLDREKHNNIRFVIGARDMGKEAKTGKTMLEIRVADVNDNFPIIHVNIIVDYSVGNTAYVPESARIGTYVASISANDVDIGINGDVTIETSVEGYVDGRPADFSPNADSLQSYFSRSDGGILSTGFPLDREDIPMFVVRISACDHGMPARCSEQNLTIIVLDENDHAPAFVNPVKALSLREDALKGTHLVKMSANDGDAVYLPAMRMSKTKERNIENSTNGDITYELHGGKGCFSINPHSGVITLVGAPDYEARKLWKLIVTAKDGGNPSLSTNSSLDINVLDVNDNSPVFTMPAVSNSTFVATILSDNVIIKINAIDYDQGAHSDVWYSLVSENGEKPPKDFILNQLSGDFRLNFSNPKMSDMLGLHTIVVKAQDLGSPPLKSEIIFYVEVTDLPYAQLMRNTQSPQNTRPVAGNVTMILIVSLGSATLLLVAILACVVVRCKRENKEIRTYSCRNAESKKGWYPTPTHESLTADVVVSSSNHLNASRDSNLNNLPWSPHSEKSLMNHPHILIKKSNSLSTLSQRTIDRKMNSFSRSEARKAALPQMPALQADGDSGKGESDQDSGSFEGKEALQRETAQGTPELLSNSIVVMEIPEAGNMGPLCTNICRQYGHSDACWMHVLDDQAHQGYGQYPEQSRPTTPSYAYYASQNGNSPRGLETISETQPLHSVLGSATDEQADEYIDETSHMVPYQSYYPGNSQSPTMHEQYYPATSYTVPRGGSYPIHTSHDAASHIPYSQQRYATTNLSHSASDLFHDGMVGAYHLHVTPGSSYGRTSPCSRGNSDYVTTSRVASPVTVHSQDAALKRRSTTSLHGELLHRRFLAAAHHPTSRADDVHVTSHTPTSQYGEVTMQETQQIIDDIDQLIDH